MANNFYMNDTRAMATDDECGLTHVPDTPSPYYGSSPDCGLTRTPRAASLGTDLFIGGGSIVTMVVVGAVALAAWSFIVGYGFSKGTQYASGILRK
jgi:hypothetical protein